MDIEPTPIEETEETVMPPTEKIFILKCSVCGTQTGTLALPIEHPVDVETAHHSELGFDDIRCDDHP